MNSLFSSQRQPLGGREASKQRASNEKCPNTWLIWSTVLKMAYHFTVPWLCAFLSKWELTAASFFFAVTPKRGHCWENFETWRMIWITKYWENLIICCCVEVVAWQNFMPHLLMVVRSIEISIPTLVLGLDWFSCVWLDTSRSPVHLHVCANTARFTSPLLALLCSAAPSRDSAVLTSAGRETPFSADDWSDHPSWWRRSRAQSGVILLQQMKILLSLLHESCF